MNSKTLKYHFLSFFILAILFFIICTLSSHLASPTRYTIDKTAPVYSQNAYRIDETKSLTLSQFLSEPSKLKKKPFKHIEWDLAAKDYWLKLDLENRQPNPIDLFIHFDNPMVDYLTVYQLNEQQQLTSTIELGDKVSELCMQRGLLVVHTGRESIKLAPPLMIHEEALLEGLSVLESAIEDVIDSE